MRIFALLLTTVLFISCKNTSEEKKEVKAIATDKTVENNVSNQKDSLIYPEEKHFKSIRQVTFGGDNAEAYWSFDDKQLVFQSNYENWGVGCDQMFLMNADETFKDKQPPMVLNCQR